MTWAQPFFGIIQRPLGGRTVELPEFGVDRDHDGLCRLCVELSRAVADDCFGEFRFGCVYRPGGGRGGEQRPPWGTGMALFSVGGNIGSAISPLWMTVAYALFGLGGTATLVRLGIGPSSPFPSEFRRIRLAAHAGRDRRLRCRIYGGLTACGDGHDVSLVVSGRADDLSADSYKGNGGSVAAGAQMLAIFSFSISIGSLVGGPAGDRFGYWQTILVSPYDACAALSDLPEQGRRPPVAGLVCAGVAVGSTFPTSIVLSLAAWPHRVGLASGLLMGLGWWPGGLGASITGLARGPLVARRRAQYAASAASCHAAPDACLRRPGANASTTLHRGLSPD